MEHELRVSLAPTIDLHTGYHGAILNSSIPGIALRATPARHLFVHEIGEEFSPHAHLHAGEFIEVEGRDFVHSARWPVIGCPAWLADTDDLMYPLLCGRTAYNPDLRKKMRDRSDLAVTRALRRRVETMSSCYAHESCVGILLRGHPLDSVRDAREWIAHLDADVDERFFDKIIPVRPAQQAIKSAEFVAKWTDPHCVQVIFCGRDFDYKNGHLALRAMRPLLDQSSSIKFVYIGKIPDDILERAPELLRGVEHYPQLGHQEVLEKLRESHIFFHPSKGDSIGISLLEAMGAGLAVVVARGGAMEYTDELFGTGGALLVDRADGGIDEEGAFRMLLDQLLTDVPLARRLADHNLTATSVGEFSIDGQSKRLGALYRKGVSSGAVPLNVRDLVGARDPCVRRMTSDEVWQDMKRYRASISDTPGYKCILL